MMTALRELCSADACESCDLVRNGCAQFPDRPAHLVQLPLDAREVVHVRAQFSVDAVDLCVERRD
jgi:hypothetical protein